MKQIQFEGGISRHGDHGVNFLIADGIYAEIRIPEENVSEDYGYLTMKRAIQDELAKRGLPTDDIRWWYDDDDNLEPDAIADAPVLVEIDEED